MESERHDTVALSLVNPQLIVVRHNQCNGIGRGLVFTIRVC